MSCIEIWTLIISIIGALAWLPYIFNFIAKICSKPEGLLLNYVFLKNATSTSVNNREKRQGTIVLLKLNIFIKNIDIFCKKLSFIFKIKDKYYNAELLDWHSTKMEDNGQKYYFPIDESQDFNLDRMIRKDASNIKYIALMLENVNLENFEEEVQSIEISLKSKKILIVQNEFPKFGNDIEEKKKKCNEI